MERVATLRDGTIGGISGVSRSREEETREGGSAERVVRGASASRERELIPRGSLDF